MLLSKRMSDLSGKVFGSLTAIRPLRLSSTGSVVWELSCTCGNLSEWVGTAVVQAAKLDTNPAVPSCGCVRDRRARETSTTHGYGRHPLHFVWQAMKQRCYNPNHPEFERYGAKGVTVCAEWLADAGVFINWALRNGWVKGLHMDKDILSDQLGVSRTYGPDTCVFRTAKENVGYSGSRANHEHNSKIKLTPEDVNQIKELYRDTDMTQYNLADTYGVKQATIWRAVHSTP